MGIVENRNRKESRADNFRKLGKLIGLKLANKCAPERLNIDKGILIIRSSSSTVKQELIFKKKELIKKISHFVHHGQLQIFALTNYS